MKTRLLLCGLVLLGLAMVGPRLGDRPRPGEAAVQSEPARIVVRADQALAPVSPMLFGQNYGPWMNTTETFVGDYRDAGVTLLVLEPVLWAAWLPWAGLGLILVVLAALMLRRRRNGMS